MTELKTKPLENGVYSIPMVTNLLRLFGNHVTQRKVRYWFCAKKGTDSLLEADYEKIGNHQSVSFLDLIEAYVASRIMAYKSLKFTHEFHEIMTKRYGKHPFATETMYVSEFNAVVIEKKTNNDGDILREPGNGQAVLDLVKDISEEIKWDKNTGLAAEWHIWNKIHIDPLIRFGQPLTIERNIPTYLIMDSFVAEGKNADVVSDCFEISKEQVKCALEFETQLQGAA